MNFVKYKKLVAILREKRVGKYRESPTPKLHIYNIFAYTDKT